MTDELKPCPFCGGEAEVQEFTECGEVIGYEVHCMACDAINPHFSAAKTRGSAVLAWNTRYKRTCKIESCIEVWDEYERYVEHRAWKLSCGHEAITADDPPAFCEVCGAEVADG